MLMQITLDGDMINKAFAEFTDRFHDENLEESLLDIAKEAMSFALDECGTSFENVMEDGERMTLVGMLTSRYLCVQILTYREILAAAEGDGPTQ